MPDVQTQNLCVTCPIHNRLEDEVAALFKKYDELVIRQETIVDKINAQGIRLRDKITLVLIIQIVTAFIAGGNLLMKLVTVSFK